MLTFSHVPPWNRYSRVLTIYIWFIPLISGFWVHVSPFTPETRLFKHTPIISGKTLSEYLHASKVKLCVDSRSQRKVSFFLRLQKSLLIKGIALISAGAGVDVLMVVSAQRACKRGRGGFSWQSARFAEEMGSSLSAESTRPRHARSLHHAELRRTVFPPSISVV